MPKKSPPIRRDRGFTLIELLVVVTILGILGGIAIPQLMTYRNEGYCGRVTSDARHAFSAMEAYYAQHLYYGPLGDTGFAASAKVSVAIDSTTPLVVSATDDSTLCPKGHTYTISGQSGIGDWS